MNSAAKKTILLVEDEVLIADLEKKGLEKYGYIVHHENTGEKAVDTIVKDLFKIDLILMDINLGSGIDGTQSAQQILAHKDIPIVFLSTHTEPEVVEKTEKITSYGYVVKNCGIVILAASIKMALKLSDEKRARKQTEKVLRESEEKFKAVVENCSSLTTIADAQGKVEFVSPQCWKVIGWPAEDIIGLTMPDFLHPDDKKWVSEEHAKVLSMQPIRDFEYRIFDKQKNLRWVSHSVTFANRGDDNLIVSTITDITERKRAEEQLFTAKERAEESEARYRLIADNTSDCIWVMDADLRFTYLSPSTVHLFGYSLIEWKTLDWNLFVAPAFMETVLTAFNELKSGKQTKLNSIILSALHKNGTEMRVEFSATGIFDKDKLFIGAIGITRDITERTKAEDALRVSEELYRFINDATVDQIYSYDRSNCFTSANRQLCENLKLKPSDIIGKTYWQLGFPDDLCREWDELHRQVYLNGSIVKNVCTPMPDGTDHYFEVNLTAIKDDAGTVIGIAGVNRDITERVRSEAVLQLTRFSVEAASDALFWITPEARIVDVNEAACRSLGFTRDELIKLSVPDVDTQYNAGVWAQHFAELRQRGSITFESIQRTKDGRLFPVEIAANYIKHSSGEFNCAFVHDISERKHAEDEVKKQLAEKEILLREVHHRIKNNMTNVESLISLQIGATANAEAKAALQITLFHVQSFRVLYEKLLLTEDYSEISIQKYTVSLIDAMAAAFNTGSRIIIDRKIDDFIISVKKAVPLGIIINELLTNIFKYAFKDRDGGTVLITIKQTGSRAALVIQDNGIGIDERIAANKSPGFGITIVKMLVEQIGGTLHIENDNGTRSVIEFEI